MTRYPAFLFPAVVRSCITVMILGLVAACGDPNMPDPGPDDPPGDQQMVPDADTPDPNAAIMAQLEIEAQSFRDAFGKGWFSEASIGGTQPKLEVTTSYETEQLDIMVTIRGDRSNLGTAPIGYFVFDGVPYTKGMKMTHKIENFEYVGKDMYYKFGRVPGT